MIFLVLLFITRKCTKAQEWALIEAFWHNKNVLTVTETLFSSYSNIN